MTYPILDQKLDASIQLRQYQTDDAGALFSLVDSNRDRLRARLTWVDRNKTLADSQRFVDHAARLQSTNGAPTVGIWHGPHLIGTVSLHPIDWRTKTAMFGYWLDENYEGRGIMTRSVAALRDFAFGELGLKRLEIVCSPNNHPSQAIAKKLGFIRQTGTHVAVWSDDPTAEMVVFADTAPSHAQTVQAAPIAA